MEPVPLMLVGCGLMGTRHMRGYAELERVAPGHVDLVAVCDRELSLAEKVADEAAELMGRRPQVYAGPEEALRCGAIAADVVTPNRTHDEVVIWLLEAGLHVLCEKPFAVTIERGKRMLRTAERVRQTLAVAENNRRDPLNRLLKYAVEQGLIGDLTFVQQISMAPGGKVIGTPWRHRLAMGGIALDVWIHLAYGIEFVAGPLATATAASRLLETERLWQPPGGASTTVSCDAVDLLIATLTFENGALGSWTTHFATRGHGQNQRLLMGTEGTAHAANDRSGKGLKIVRDGETLEGESLLAALPDWSLNEVETKLFGERPASYDLPGPETDRKLLAAEVADFADAIRERRPPEVPAGIGLRSVALIYTLLESAVARRPVKVTEVLDGEVRNVQGLVEASRA